MTIKTGHVFPAAFGFTGSSSDGPVPVRAYQRGGRVSSMEGSKNSKMTKGAAPAKKQLRQPVIAATNNDAANAGRKLAPGYRCGGKVKGTLSRSK